MKKCPYCKSELTDNAQFCLYCMKSLDEKTVLPATTAKRKPLPWILLAVLSLITITLIVVLFVSLGKKTPSDVDDVLGKTNTSSIMFDATAAATKSPTVAPTKAPTKAPTAVPTETATTTGTKSPTGTPTKAPTSAPTAVPTETPAITYSYRNATPEDDYEQSSSITDNAVVITGIITPEESGIYYIPRKIDGKKVVAITADFSSDIEMAATVKTIVIPSTVRTVWAGALSNCVNITDIYISNSGMEESIEFGIKVLPDLDSRNYEITFHHDTDCCNRNYHLFEVEYVPSMTPDYAYHAKYEYWNPNTPID